VTVVDKEIERQQENLKEKKELKNEVRGALEDGTTKFLRPLRGAPECILKQICRC
jgi:Glu-tRNA(Gln) amidotransferase subunit E-like FAD-binding protein